VPTWSNWSGKLSASPREVRFLRSEADAAALARAADQNGRQIRVAGATHSHAPLVSPTDILADTQGLAGVFSVDLDKHTAWVGAGTRIYALGAALNQAGLALSNQGDIDEQAIAGATATGTHGTGVKLKNLSATVIGARIALANGELVDCSPVDNTELWQASRLHLGAFGIVTRLNLQLQPAYCLQETAWHDTLKATLNQFPSTAKQHRHHEFFWYPQNDRAQGKSINITAHAPQYPLAEEGKRCAWSHEVLPNHRPHKHTEMEYSVPIEQGPACMAALCELLNSRFDHVRWPVEYRTLAADDVWMSTAYARDTVTISVHQDIQLDDEAYFRACEELFLEFEGRPHWGKVNYLSGDQLAQHHPQWDNWWKVRDQIDPNHTFLNAYLQSLR